MIHLTISICFISNQFTHNSSAVKPNILAKLENEIRTDKMYYVYIVCVICLGAHVFHSGINSVNRGIR